MRKNLNNMLGFKKPFVPPDTITITVDLKALQALIGAHSANYLWNEMKSRKGSNNRIDASDIHWMYKHRL